MSRRRKWQFAFLVCAAGAVLALSAAACHPGRAGNGGNPPPHPTPDGGVEPPPVPEGRLPLHDGWSLQSSAKISAGGAELSTPGYVADGWVSTSASTS